MPSTSDSFSAHFDHAPALIGQSPPILELRKQIQSYAQNRHIVLIEGESGSGKECISHALHQASSSHGSLVVINCAAIPSPLLESILFGHVRGAFTDARESRTGLFEESDHGTLLLDEIGELPLTLQPKLLRVLENGEFRRLGEASLRRCRARILAATNRNLLYEVQQGRFRADLYHRLAILTLCAPPLRTLGSDKILLLNHFRRLHAKQLQLAEFQFSPQALQRWESYTFPGNVRELRNLVIRLLCRFHGQTLGLYELDNELHDLPASSDEIASMPAGFNLDRALHYQEQHYIKDALNRAQGNISEAARLLGLPRSTLCSRLRVLDIRQPALTER